MKSNNIIKKICFSSVSAVILAVTGSSCTNLDEKVFSQIDADNFYQSETSVQGAVASIYSAAMQGWFEYFWYLSEFSADQVAWRTWNAGTYGYDDAQKFVLSTQTWNSRSAIIQSAWQTAWTCIGLCNTLLADLNNINPGSIDMTREALDSYIAEVRTMRAWAYYNNFELWGGALPLFTAGSSTEVPGSVAGADFKEGCNLIWQFIADELDETLPNLSVEDGTNATRTRLNQGMNRMLKMRLLLNSELWTGTAKYTECAALAQDILNGKYGTYSLAQDYKDIYNVDNYSCPEIVFAFAQQVSHWTNNNRVTPFLPYNYGDIFGSNMEQSGWDCTIVVPSHDNSGTISDTNDYSTGSKSFIYDYGDKLGAVYDRFIDGDIRKQPFHCDAQGIWEGNFLMGQQYNYTTGEELKSNMAGTENYPQYFSDQVGTFNGDGHVLEIVMSPRWGMGTNGYRFLRYPVLPESSGIDWRNAAQVEFRLAEVYYTLAECQMRAGNSTEARALVNQVRQRYFNGVAPNQPGPGFDNYDMDWMLSEWGLEFLDEGRRRRTDLRRFDKFTQGQWWFFGRATDPERQMPAKRDRIYEWYPMPETALMVNPGLEQVPGY